MIKGEPIHGKLGGEDKLVEFYHMAAKMGEKLGKRVECLEFLRKVRDFLCRRWTLLRKWLGRIARVGIRTGGLVRFIRMCIICISRTHWIFDCFIFQASFKIFHLLY